MHVRRITVLRSDVIFEYLVGDGFGRPVLVVDPHVGPEHKLVAVPVVLGLLHKMALER